MKKIVKTGVKAARSAMFKEDKIWSRYSDDKVDIGQHLARVIRTIVRNKALNKELSALSIGSSDEPQFRILETMFRAGLYLVDIDRQALGLVKERIHRQFTDHVSTIAADYRKLFLRPDKTKLFMRRRLKGRKADLVALYHSLYYAEQKLWGAIFENILKYVLSGTGAIHAVLMSSECNNPYSTTWLYNHFAGKFFGHVNNQDLLAFKDELSGCPAFKKCRIISKTSHVKFYVEDFDKLMAVVWMILLYPNVHPYTLKQRREITGHIYNKFWKPKRPLVQQQDHLVVYRGVGSSVLI